MSAFNRTTKPSAKRINQSRSERDSSGTTVAAEGGEGDGADSPTQTKTKAPKFIFGAFVFVKRLAQMN